MDLSVCSGNTTSKGGYPCCDPVQTGASPIGKQVDLGISGSIVDIEYGIESTLLHIGASGVYPGCESDLQRIFVWTGVLGLWESLSCDLLDGVSGLEINESVRHSRSGKTQTGQGHVESTSPTVPCSGPSQHTILHT
jgi:hypothetical protein